MAEVSFGEWLKRRRKAGGLTQEQLAQQLSCSTITLRKIEAEERRPSAQIVERLADIFNIPPNERTKFLRYARGDWQAVPTSVDEDAPWLVSSNPKTHLITFLFTDIEGSAKLWESAPEQMKIALERHHEILEEAVSTNGGTVFQIVGDAFCAAFTTTPSAISAAVTAQSQLYQEPWDLPFPIRVRMGIHTGEAEPTSNDSPTGGYASNQTLNRVARILSAGHGGQVLLSLATKELAKDSLPSNTELRDMGEHYLRNLIHPEHLFQLNIAGLPSEFPPLNTRNLHRHNLPVQLTNFIGREQEITVVHGYLSKKDIHLVTLIGPPGIGKTRLSIEAVRTELSDFPDGVFFIALAPLGDSSLVAPTIAQTLGFVETKNRSPFERLKDGIGDKQMLIVLDNVEHLVEETATLVSDLLLACPRLKILTSSREALRIPGEWLYSVPTLSSPAETQLQAIDMETVSQYAALTLFAERARAVRSDFALNAENIEAVAMICTQLDGLPLAIELIAARIRLMSPQALLERLSGQFTLYADGMRAVSARQKTLHGAIAWSYDLLSPEEQKLFTHLSVFSGGFTLETAESIFSRTIPNKSVSDLMASLLDKSLLQRTLDARGEPRFSMLVTIQQFALDRLQSMGEESAVRYWHFDYFLNLAEEGEPHMYGHGQLEWLGHLQTELDNFRGAFEWNLAQQTNVEKSLRLAIALGSFWRIRSDFHEAQHWLEIVLSLDEAEHYPNAYAKAVLIMGIFQMMYVSPETGEPLLSQSVMLARRLDDNHILGEALDYLGLALAFQKKFDQAHTLLEESQMLFRAANDKKGIALTKWHLGWIFEDEGNQTTGFELIKQALTLFEELGDIHRQSILLRNIGWNLLEAGDFKQGSATLRRALGASYKVGSKLEVGNTFMDLAFVEEQQSNYAKSLQFLWTAQKLFLACGAKAHVPDFEQKLDRYRAHLDDRTFDAAIAQAQKWTVEQAIAYALED